MFTTKHIRCVNLIKNLNIRNLYINSPRNQLINKTVIPLCNVNKNLLPNINLQIYRYKKKDKKKPSKTVEVSESEDEEETTQWEDEVTDKQTKLMNVKVNSLRADVILKAGLGIARNKIETMFYESKIRVNGQKLMKKSEVLSEGDEVDIIREINMTNPNFLTVSRVEILSSSERGEGLNVKLRRNKVLLIENYPHDPYKG